MFTIAPLYNFMLGTSLILDAAVSALVTAVARQFLGSCSFFLVFAQFAK